MSVNRGKSFSRGIDVLRENYVVYGDNVSRFFQSALGKAEIFSNGLRRVYYGSQGYKSNLHQKITVKTESSDTKKARFHELLYAAFYAGQNQYFVATY
ncbi:TPA: hypothetical protein ACXE8V_004819 [Pluralibacter gergoviae]